MDVIDEFIKSILVDEDEEEIPGNSKKVLKNNNTLTKRGSKLDDGKEEYIKRPSIVSIFGYDIVASPTNTSSSKNKKKKKKKKKNTSKNREEPKNKEYLKSNHENRSFNSRLKKTKKGAHENSSLMVSKNAKYENSSLMQAKKGNKENNSISHAKKEIERESDEESEDSYEDDDLSKYSTEIETSATIPVVKQDKPMIANKNKKENHVDNEQIIINVEDTITSKSGRLFTNKTQVDNIKNIPRKLSSASKTTEDTKDILNNENNQEIQFKNEFQRNSVLSADSFNPFKKEYAERKIITNKNLKSPDGKKETISKLENMFKESDMTTIDDGDKWVYDEHNGKRKTLVIGAGVSGVSSVKATLENDENRYVICYEKSNDIGGTWNYSDDNFVDNTLVSIDTVAATSKEMFSFSDFLFPKETPNFLKHSVIKDYLKNYCDHFKLLDRVVFNRCVTSVSIHNTTAMDYKVMSRDVLTGKLFCEIFDNIYICNGQYAVPRYMPLKDRHLFKGTCIHSKEFKYAEEYRDRNVCIVGFGHSALDIASELGKLCKTLYLSQADGNYVKRKTEHGLPHDLTDHRRCKEKYNQRMPSCTVNRKSKKEANQYFDHKMYNIQPQKKIMNKFSVVSDDFPSMVLSGSILLRPGLSRLYEDGVIFSNGELAKVDTIILATGYDIDMHFISTKIIQLVNGELDLYRNIFPPEYPTMAFIGYVRSNWAMPPVIEMQTRFTAAVFSDIIKLPTIVKMKKHIRTAHRTRRETYGDDRRHSMKTRGFVYVERLASCLGCRPSVLRTAFSDPMLACRLFKGVLGACQYRLKGPHRRSRAREAVTNTWSRVMTPVVGEKQAVKYQNGQWWRDLVSVFLVIGIPMVVAVCAYFSVKFFTKIRDFVGF